MKVILDTNFLIYCAKHTLDYVEELDRLLNEDYQLVVPDKVVEELRIVSEKKKSPHYRFQNNPRYKKTTGKDKEAAILAMKLLEHNNIDVVKIQGDSVDEAIINLANEDKKNIVCTLDKEMRKTLGRVILLNLGNKLMLTR